MLEEILGTFNKVQIELFEIIPRLTLSVTILLLGILTAYTLKWFSTSVTKWSSQIIPKYILEKFITKNDVEIFSLILGKIIFFMILFLTMATSLKKLGLDIVSSWFENIASYFPSALAGLVIFIFGWKLKDFLEDIFVKSLSKVNFAQSKALSKLISWSVFVISTAVALEQIGLNISLLINLSIVLTGIVTGGIALTFALGAKSNITDILACYQINRHINIGEEITIANHKGVIQSIGPVFVILESEEEVVTLPGNFFNKNILTIKKIKV